VRDLSTERIGGELGLLLEEAQKSFWRVTENPNDGAAGEETGDERFQEREKGRTWPIK